jgi:mono/diheme cytochrome c family protein
MNRLSSAKALLFAACVVCVALVSAIVIGQEGTLPFKLVKIEYKMDQLRRTVPIAEDVAGGRVIWLQRCAYCHDGLGTPTYNTIGPWIDSSIVQARSEAKIRDKIANGSPLMPAFQYGLTAAQIDQVIAFLKSVSPDEKPTPEQKAGKTNLPGEL